MGGYDLQFQQALARLRSTGLTEFQALGQLTRDLVNQAYLLSSLDFFWASAWITLLLLPIIWFTRGALAGGTHAAAD